jgi:ompA family protein
MARKAFVTGRTQNRTALGIIAAYLELYPNTSLSELNNLFSKSEVCPDAGIDKLFYTTKEIENEKKNGWEWFQKDQACFTQEGEWLKVKGTKVAFCKMWTAPSLAKLQKKAEKYGITAQVGDIPKNSKDYSVGYTIQYEGKKGGIPWWIWLLLGLLVFGSVAYFAMGKKEQNNPEPIVEQPKVEEVQKVVETKVNEIKENFNAAQFEKRKYDLNESSKTVLLDLVKLLNENPSIKLQIEGHTSAEGDDKFNQKLSTNRAKAAVDFLVSKGIDNSRLSYKGFGSNNLKNASDPEAEENRRVEFVVIK